MSDVHKCLGFLCLALLVVDEKLPGCKAAHNWIVILSIVMATFCGI